MEIFGIDRYCMIGLVVDVQPLNFDCKNRFLAGMSLPDQQGNDVL